MSKSTIVIKIVWTRLYHPILLPLLIAACGDLPLLPLLYACGCRQTICLQVTRAQHAIGLHAKTCWLHQNT